eukprot:SAG31_NODE_38386_length_296_cov_1.284264_1_plen_55_part_01
MGSFTAFDQRHKLALRISLESSVLSSGHRDGAVGNFVDGQVSQCEGRGIQWQAKI